jgi:hypothetical protein
MHQSHVAIQQKKYLRMSREIKSADRTSSTPPAPVTPRFKPEGFAYPKFRTCWCYKTHKNEQNAPE